MIQKPNPIPCGSSGTISSTSDETSQSRSYGSVQQYTPLYDEAVTAAFNHVWHEAMKSAKCGAGCHPLVDGVSITITKTSYVYQWIASSYFFYGTAQFVCELTYSWTANVTCTAELPPSSLMLPPFARNLVSKD